MSSLSEYNPIPTKKPKATRACDVCRKKKVKCDGATPVCSHCAAFVYDCTFEYKPKKRGPNPSQETLLENRLERLEQLILPMIEEKYSKGCRKTNLFSKSKDTDVFHDAEVEEGDVLSKISQSLSNLKLNRKQYFRYLGSSSGLYVLEGGKYNQDGLCQDLRYRSHDNGGIPLVLSRDLPLPELRTRLLSIYFDRFHRYIPIFNKIDFQDRIDSGQEVSLTLLNAIYALVCLHVHMDDLFDNIETHVSVTNYFFTQAKAYLDREYLTPTVQTVQALILMAFQPEVGWIYSGMAIRIGQELGLHRNLNLDNMDLVQKQNRQLAWWGCFFLDRLVSAIVGRPMHINEEDCDVKLLIDVRNKGSDKNPRENEFVASVRYFNQVIRLFTILTQTLRTVYGVAKQSKLKARDTLLHLNKSLSDWNATLLPEFWYDITLGRPNNQYVTMLALYYHYTVILTNRPYIAPLSHNASPLNNLALQACAKSASIVSYILYHIPTSCLLHGIQIKATFIFCASTIHTMNITSSDSNLAYASKANLIVNLNILKKINIHSTILFRTLLFVEDMIQSHGLSDMFSATDYLASLPSRHDSESLVFQSRQTCTNSPTTPVEHPLHLKSRSSPSGSCFPTDPTSSTDRNTSEVYTEGDIGKILPVTNVNSFNPPGLGVHNTIHFGDDNKENITDFDLELWNVFISMFNQAQLPASNAEK
ncbi:hypothetical protein K7432_010354 [Basidiobolus ranarum]|uniref:Zn(2)-C6 fungal-type domain-containing protein n=1 Tax=Basidiobolus ranarum TaxID=34480 RepID=A0ABR2VVM7_9FUNG